MTGKRASWALSSWNSASRSETLGTPGDTVRASGYRARAKARVGRGLGLGLVVRARVRVRARVSA